MSLKKKRKEASEFLDNLVEFCSDFEDLSLDELKSELREDGIDPEALLLKAKGLIESKIKDAKLAWKEEAKKKRTSLLKQLATIKVEVPESISDLRKKISDIIKGEHGGDIQYHAAAHFRNLEEIRDEDLISLYEDFMNLKLLNDRCKKDETE